jgi:hypothetical protein
MKKLHKRTRALSRRVLIKLAMVSTVLMLGSLTTTPARAADCVPSCRDGFLCHQGQCIEACNPPCAEGELCTGEGQCVAATSSTAPGYTAGNTGAVDSAGKPSTAIPATFVGLGGFLLIAGGVTFATSEWSGYYYDYYGTGQWVGIGLMTLGGISLAVATPFLVKRVQQKRAWERQHAQRFGKDLALAPIVERRRRNQTYGVTLRGKF